MAVEPVTPAASPALAAQLFSALGDPTRLCMVARLAKGGALSIGEMGDGLAISRQAVTKHLDILHAAGLVSRRKNGREVHFALDSQGMDAARDWLEQASAQWDRTLARFKALVEER